MTAFFVTATGTDIGKTYASAALIRAWRAAGHPVSAIKPLMSGFGEQDLAASDAGLLLAAMGRPVTPDMVSEICLHRFEAPLAPNVAMQRAGMVQDYVEILSFSRQSLPETDDNIHLIEGAGGLMSPVTNDKLHMDLITDLGLPAILVTAGYLGAVSHTLTALDALNRRNIPVAALIVSQPTSDAEDPNHLLGETARWSQAPAFTLPHGSDASHIADALLKPQG